MKHVIIRTFILIILSISLSVYAQEKSKQSETKIELPELYLEQKLDRSAMNLTAFIVGGIAYAKSMDQTPEQFGTFIGGILAPSWEDVKGKGLKPFIEGLYKNFQTDKNCQLEIISASKKTVNVKMKRFGDSTVKDYGETGVTVHDYDRCMWKIMQSITNYLGFYYEQGSQDDWIIFWISSGKKFKR